MTIDLNAGWEYIQVPQPPSVWDSADAVPRTLWKLIRASSEETTGEKAEATKAFDGNPDTFWHTEWKNRQPGFPHELVIDLGAVTDVVGFRILTRQTGPQNGRPKHYQLFLSNSAEQWHDPVIGGEVPNSSELYEARFAAHKGRFLRLLFLDGHRPNEPFLALAEIGLIRNLDLSKRTDWQTQYSITTVQLGDRKFDLKGDDLESLKKTEMRAIEQHRWQPATIPHAAWIRPLNTPEIWQGVAYYRRSLNLPAGTENRHIELEIDGMIHSADLWLNGKHLAERRGGYMPMIVDLTGKLEATNDILLRVDNSDNPLIPPGKPQSQLDFMYGAGITRKAEIRIADGLHITDALTEQGRFGGGVYVTYPEVDVQGAKVRVRTHVRNSSSHSRQFDLKQSIVDATGKVVATTTLAERLNAGVAERRTQDLWVETPNLWSPNDPYRYTLITEIVEGKHTVDQVKTPIGIRTITVSRKDGLVINGKPVRLVGTNRHQDYPWVGPALSDNANRRDALLIKLSGHNIVRLSHYPQSPSFLDACDELGILTIPCIAGWQFMNNDPRYIARVKRDIQELIRRDRNHPSVAFWEASLNETYPPVEIAKDWYETAKSELAEGGQPIAGDGTAGVPWDVVYNGWKDDLSRPQDTVPDKPGYIREYGDYEFGGAYSSTRVRIGQGMDQLLMGTWNYVWSYNRFRTQYPWTMGAGTWEMFDHNVPFEYAVSASGLADLFRREKPSFWFYRSQEDKKPYLKLATTWQPGADYRDIVVFTNCDEASLYVNGKLIQTMKPEKGRSTRYEDAKPFDGTNTENLPHPPIVFRKVSYVPGTLKVVGLCKGKPSQSDVVQTASNPTKLKVWVDDLGVPMGQNDLVFVRAAVVDAKGVLCPDVHQRIVFTVKGAMIAGEDGAPCEMGIATIILRTSTKRSSITVHARTSDGRVGEVALGIK
jgi:beta-galactosidase